MPKFIVEIKEVKSGGCFVNILWAFLTFMGCMLVISQCGK